jgi:3-phosphoglycerate kinase
MVQKIARKQQKSYVTDAYRKEHRERKEIFKKIRNIAGKVLGKEIRFRKELNQIHVKLK